MSASAPAVQKTWPVGKSYTAHLAIPFPDDEGKPGSAVVEWQPFVPAELTEDEKTDYNAGLYSAMLEYLHVTGAPQSQPIEGAVNDADA